MNVKSDIFLVWQAIFEAMVKFSLAPDLRDLLTFGDLINLLICIMIIWINRVLKYKHFECFLLFYDNYLRKYSDLCFPYPYSLVQKWVPMGVAYDIIFSVIAGLLEVYPSFFNLLYGVLQ